MNDLNQIRTQFRQCTPKWQAMGLLLEKTEKAQASGLHSKARLSCSLKGFGSRYYYMMRLLDAFLATEALCLTDDAPHKAAGNLLEEWFHFLPESPKRIVSARHRLKYDRITPQPEIANSLETIITILENLVQLKHPANSLQVKKISLHQ